MSLYRGETAFTHAETGRTGILVTNLGTPDAPEPGALRRYLKQFLWDPRVVEVSRPIWWLILNGIILNVRPRRSAKAYQSVWTEEGSPLLTISKRQRAALETALGGRVPGPVSVALAMRYGNPSIEAGLEALKAAGARRILVLPLYPQYAGATTGSTFDAVADVLKQWRWVPELRFINHYHDEPAYIGALVQGIQRHWAQHPRGELLVFSFHGIPQRYFHDGDPYFCHCQKTARLVAEGLGLSEGEYRVTFQSRVGREEWLKPYTDETMKALPRAGVKRVDVVCPGFSADCLETIEEIGEENRGYFMEAGGEAYHYIPALNDDAAHIDALADLVCHHGQGWPEFSEVYDETAAGAAAEARVARARAMGAAE
ncbi:MAG: ferrochelatase [Gammaproteobacteria bacterium]|nr:ferrochelatase [Gammaproteobacteria bacterium]